MRVHVADIISFHVPYAGVECAADCSSTSSVLHQCQPGGEDHSHAASEARRVCIPSLHHL